MTNREKIERAKKDISEVIDSIQKWQDSLGVVVHVVEGEELERAEDVKLYLMIAFENVALAVATAEKK